MSFSYSLLDLSDFIYYVNKYKESYLKGLMISNLRQMSRLSTSYCSTRSSAYQHMHFGKSFV